MLYVFGKYTSSATRAKVTLHVAKVILHIKQGQQQQHPSTLETRRRQLTVFLSPADAFHAMHDGVAVLVKRRNESLAKNALSVVAYVVVIESHVHLPS